MFFFKTMVGKFMFWSVVLLLLVGYTGARALWNNQNAGNQRDFNSWQSQYKDIAYALATDPAVKEATRETPIEVKQVTVGQFPLIQQDGSQQQRVDRCQSCHIGLLNPQMTAENIIKVVKGDQVSADQVISYLEAHPDVREVVKTLGTHPGVSIEGNGARDLGVVHGPHETYGIATDASVTDADKADYSTQKGNLKKHPFPTFGCTTCHYGAGRELVEQNAHQQIPENRQLGYYEFTPTPGVQMLPAKYMEAACAQCHASYDSKTFQINYLPQMATIARGEQLFKSQACYGCHKIEGYSKGNIGPELTYEGRAKPVAAIAHQLWDPRYQVGTCVMPYFFSVREHNTDLPNLATELVDPRAETTRRADVVVKGTNDYNEDVAKTLEQHGYIPDKARQDDVDALVTFIASQTGQNYADSQASRFATISAYNQSSPADVPVTAAEGKRLFAESGCYSCHYIGNPNVPHVTGDPKYGKGGIAGPELSWEGSRHSQQWLVEHYKNPQEFVPGSIMPIFPFSDSQRAALSLYDAAQRPSSPSARPVSPDQDLPSAALKAQGAQNQEVRYMTR